MRAALWVGCGSVVQCSVLNLQHHGEGERLEGGVGTEEFNVRTLSPPVERSWICTIS